MQADTNVTGSFDMSSRTTWHILTPAMAVSGLLLTIGLGGAWYVHRTNRAVSDSLDKHLSAAQSAERLVLAIRDLRTRLDRFADNGAAEHLDAASSLLQKVQGELRQDRQRNAAGDAGSEGAAEDLQTKADAFSRQFAQLDGRQSDEQSRAVAREWITAVNNQLLVPAESQLKARQQTLASTSRQNLSVAERVGLGLMLLGVCGAVAGLLTGFGVARSFHRSLVEISLPVRDIAGRLNEVVGPITISSNTDLSELDDSLRTLAEKTAEVVQRLQHRQQQSLRHDQLAALGQLAAGLAHELRNPLMSVKLIVQTAAERTDHSLRQRDFAVIEDEITRLEELLQAFLDFARPPQPKRQTVDVRNVIVRAVEVVRPRAAQQQVQLHLDATDPVVIEADESQMRQLLLNLLINSLDVLPAGGNVWLEVTAGPRASRRESSETVAESRLVPASEAGRDLDTPCVVLRVADDGPGFSDDVINEAFEPFVSTKDTGIGLGLSICSQIVESHGGRITAGNRREGGAEVTIQLPQCPSARSVDLDVAVSAAEDTLSSSAD